MRATPCHMVVVKFTAPLHTAVDAGSGCCSGFLLKIMVSCDFGHFTSYFSMTLLMSHADIFWRVNSGNLDFPWKLCRDVLCVYAVPVDLMTTCESRYDCHFFCA